MKTIPIPMTKATWLALALFVALILAGRWIWAITFAVGWSLGGDGAVFTSVKAMVAEARKRRSAV